MPEITESEAAAYAASHSFYDLLNLEKDAKTNDVRRAYRKASLLYHPDKNPDNPKAVETFHLVTIALDVLCDEALRRAYDNALEARAAKKRRNEAYDAQRRKMKQDLEERENVAKKAKTDEDERKRELERLKDEGVRARMEMDERRRRAAEAEAVAAEAQAAAEADAEAEKERNGPWKMGSSAPAAASTTTATTATKSRFSEMDRTVRVRWKRKGQGESCEKTDMLLLFRQFGPIEECVLKSGSDKDKDKKYRTALVVFQDITGAYAAVKHNRSEDPDDVWKLFRNVTWAGGKEPDLGINVLGKTSSAGSSAMETEDAPKKESSSKTIQQTFNTAEAFSIPSSSASASTSARSNGKVPTFSSFNPAKAQATSTAATTSGPAKDDYESITIMRMRERAAERRKLAEEIRRREAEEADQEQTTK